MFATAAIRNLIREGKNHQIPSFMQSSGADGMLTFDQHLALEGAWTASISLRAGPGPVPRAARSSCASPDGRDAGDDRARLTKTRSHYEALDAAGKRTQGQASTRRRDGAAASTLRQQGLTPLSLTEAGKGLQQGDRDPRPRPAGSSSRTSPSSSRQFATMTASGLSLLRSLAILEEQTAKPKLAQGDPRRPPRHRVRAVAVRRDEEAGQDLPPPDDRDDRGRRDRRLPRQGARPDRDELREGREPARQDQVGADLPRDRHLLQHR